MADTTDIELQKWIDKWDACNQGTDFPKAPEIKVPDKISEDEDPYWKELYASMERQKNPDILNEDKATPNPVKVPDNYDRDLYPNPIVPDTYGKDQDQPKPQWIVNDQFKELDDMKRRLYDLEVKLNAKDGKWSETPINTQPTEDSAIFQEIQSLKKKLDAMSSHYGLDGEWGSDAERTPKLPPYDEKAKRAS